MSHLMTDGIRPCGRPDGHNGFHWSLEAWENKKVNGRKWSRENRAKANAYQQKWRANHADDPEYRERVNANGRKAYRKLISNPEWVEKERKRNSQRMQIRYATDQDYRQNHLEYNRLYSRTAAGMISAMRSDAKRRGNR